MVLKYTVKFSIADGILWRSYQGPSNIFILNHNGFKQTWLNHHQQELPCHVCRNNSFNSGVSLVPQRFCILNAVKSAFQSSSYIDTIKKSWCLPYFYLIMCRLQWLFCIFQEQINRYLYPADTLRNNDVVITSKRRHFDVITSQWRCFDIITTLLLRHVFRGYVPIILQGRGLRKICIASFQGKRDFYQKMTNLLPRWACMDDFEK